MTGRTNTTTPEQSDNEYLGMPPEMVACLAADMLDQHSLEHERALALAIVVRDWLRSQDDGNTDMTYAVLAEMLVDELGGAPEQSIKQCLFALLEKCQPREDKS